MMASSPSSRRCEWPSPGRWPTTTPCVVLGEDVGRDGGVFRATDGLLARFGPDRVFDTPVSESLFGGLAVGLAAQGFRPVVEFQFEGFMYPALDQLVNHAGRLRNRTRGRLSCPMVLRAPYGGGIGAPSTTPRAPRRIFAHIPGIRVVIPSSPARPTACCWRRSAIRTRSCSLSPRGLPPAREEVADDGAPLPLDTCRARAGGDLTLVSWGALSARRSRPPIC